MQIPSRIAPRQLQTQIEAGAIPRIIHQTFARYDVAERMHAAAMTWVELNPEFEYRYYTDNDQRDLITTEFGPEVLAAYERLENGAFRADLWRYCQLYVTGGVYVDIDSVCKMPLSNMLLPEDQFVSARASNLPTAVFNGFMCCTPQHPFMKTAIDRAVQVIHETTGQIDGYMATGPGNLGAAINICLGRKEKTKHTLGRTEEAGCVFRLLEKHPRNDTMPSYLTHEGATLMLTKYPDYHADLKESGLVHWRETARYNKPVSPLRRLARRAKRLIRC